MCHRKNLEPGTGSVQFPDGEINVEIFLLMVSLENVEWKSRDGLS
jgi:hypothetical protein